jgi:hypothetical protein
MTVETATSLTKSTTDIDVEGVRKRGGTGAALEAALGSFPGTPGTAGERGPQRIAVCKILFLGISSSATGIQPNSEEYNYE